MGRNPRMGTPGLVVGSDCLFSVLYLSRWSFKALISSFLLLMSFLASSSSCSAYWSLFTGLSGAQPLHVVGRAELLPRLLGAP